MDMNATYSDKYSFHYDLKCDNKKVICVTYYKGKLIKGIAKCAPCDKFDVEAGEKLAYLRCKSKFLKKKSEQATNSYSRAVVTAAKAEMNRLNAIDFFNEVSSELYITRQELANLEASLENN